LDRRLGAGVRLFERDLEVVAQVRATLWTSAAAPAEDIAEPEDIAQVREEVAEVGEDRRIEALGAARVHALVAEAVVARALLLVGKDRIRFGGLLEALFGLCVARIAIGVVLQRELAIRALDFVVGRAALDAQNLVVVTLHGRRHALVPTACATRTIDGRINRSPIR